MSRRSIQYGADSSLEPSNARSTKADTGRFQPVFSIGHSHHSVEHFVELLRRHRIDLVLDVRSSPFSRRAPQFNRGQMREWLAAAGIRYSFGGKALGGRPADPGVYVRGQANYERMAESDEFRVGLRRVARAAKSTRIALMCAEAEPLDCHRFLLIGRVASRAIPVYHILSSGLAEPHRATEQRLLAAAGLAQTAMFDPGFDALAKAYALQAARVAYSQAELASVPDSAPASEG